MIRRIVCSIALAGLLLPGTVSNAEEFSLHVRRQAVDAGGTDGALLANVRGTRGGQTAGTIDFYTDCAVLVGLLSNGTIICADDGPILLLEGTAFIVERGSGRVRETELVILVTPHLTHASNRPHFRPAAGFACVGDPLLSC